MSNKFSLELNPVGVSPLLSVLPSLVAISELDKYSPSYYARYEKAANLKSVLLAEGENSNLGYLVAEIDMLRVVLDWLNSSNTEKI